MIIAAGSDHAGFELKEKLVEYLKKRGFEVLDLGTDSSISCDYPDYAQKVAKAIVNKDASMGILVCGTGIGMSIAANKVHGIRAAVLSDEFSAEATRSHNDANILCLGARVVDEERAKRLLDIFLDTPFSNEEKHIRRINKIEDQEKM